jgi:hypothetical protein
VKMTTAVSMIAAATTETAVTTRFFCLGDSSRFNERFVQFLGEELIVAQGAHPVCRES